MQIDSNGVLYNHRIPENAIAATNFDGTTLWKGSFYHDYVNEVVLGNNEENLYLATAEGHVEAYTVGGIFKWRSEKFGRILSIELTQNAIILGLGGEDFSSSS